MKKLNILKAIVDFVWIMSCISIPLLLLFLGYITITNKEIDIPINVNGIEVSVVNIQTKVLLVLIILAGLLVMYCIFIFRKILSAFQSRKIFDVNVIKNFNTIGILLIISALMSGIPAFIIKLLKKQVSLDLGLNPFIVIFSLGLFFMVLSEVFMIAKTQKEENELTI